MERIICSKCAKEVDRYRPRSLVCRSCAIEAAIGRNRKNPDRVRRAVRKWKEENPEKLKQQRDRLSARRRGMTLEQYAAWKQEIQARKEEAAERSAAYRQRIANSPTAGMTPNERYHWRMKNDPGFVINMRMRNAIRKALKGGKGGRKWEEILGYTLDDLRAHLAAQMPKGHTLEDLGRIHIDHIIPKILFDVTNEDELRAAWALPNLRPTTASENLSKGARRHFLL